MGRPRLPARVTVAGAGTMGAGIAGVFARAGCEVRLTARTARSLDAARERAAEVAGQSASAIVYTTSVEPAFAGADLVIETIVEEIEAKRRVLSLAESTAGSGAILVTNTSSLPLASIGQALRRGGRFAGLHWFNPPELVELVEVVGAGETEPEVLSTLAAWMEELGKAPVLVSRDTPGFVANRLQYALLREAYALVDAGVCTFDDVDRTLTHGLGVRWAGVGPFQTVDLAGLDVHLATAENLFPELSTEARPPKRLRELVAAGELGCKSGSGLLGDYDRDRIGDVVRRRLRVLTALPRLRDGKEE